MTTQQTNEGRGRERRRSVVILGATSTVAREIARRCAADGFDLVLAAVEEDQLEEIARDIFGRSRGTDKDVGAVESTDGPVQNRPLTPINVGPLWQRPMQP